MKPSQRTRPRVCFFVGPSVSANEIRDACAGIDAEIELLPPVQQGDLLRMQERLPAVIGIIDGYFFQVPSVLHKEILYALERGARVLGAASLGALRAAELDVFGMEGIGEIYRLYKSGMIDGDDEVAVVHADADSGFRSLSEPLVNLRHNLQRARARKIISARTAAAIIASTKRMPFVERRHPAILDNPCLDCTARDELLALRHFLREEAVDLKRDDALALVRVVAERIQGKQPWPEHPRVCVSRTTFFHTYHREYVGHTTDGQPVPDMRVLSFLKLLSPGFPRLLRRVALRSFAVDEALHRGILPRDPDQLVACFRERQGLACDETYAAWLREHCMAPHELHACLSDNDLEALLLNVYRSCHPTRQGRAALYRAIITDVARRTGIGGEGMACPPWMPPNTPWEVPLLRESKLRGAFRAALAWAGPLVQWYAELSQRAPHVALIAPANRLEQWAAERWHAVGAFDQAVLERGFTSQHEFLEVARVAYLAPDDLVPRAYQSAEYVA